MINCAVVNVPLLSQVLPPIKIDSGRINQWFPSGRLARSWYVATLPRPQSPSDYPKLTPYPVLRRDVVSP